jgi:hypothetical protein
MKISFSDIINTCKELLINPEAFWKTKSGEKVDHFQLLTTFLIPILLTVSVAVFLGEFFRSSHFYIGFALLKSTRVIVLFLLQYFIGVFFTNELMKTFGAEKNIDVSRILVVYSMTPLLLVSIVTGLFQFLYVIDILGIYSFYLFWVGANELLEFPKNKKSSYTLITIIVNFFVFSFLSITLSKLLTAYY